MTDELSIAELENELAAELPTRTLMSGKRYHSFKSYGYKPMSYKHMSYKHMGYKYMGYKHMSYNNCSCSCGDYGKYGYGGDYGNYGYGGGYGNYGYGGYGYGGGFGGGFGGGVSNFNATGQSIFNPQTAVGFGGGHITQVGANTNFNNSNQFGVSTGFGGF